MGSSVPTFDLTSAPATTFDNENCNFVSFNSELDSAVTEYLTQVTELGYRPTTNGANLSTFKSTDKWVEKSNSVSSVNSRTSERLLAVQFELNSKEKKEEDNKGQNTEEENEVDANGLETEDIKGDNSALDNPIYLSLSDCSSGQNQPLYENSGITIDTEEPIYENLEEGILQEEILKKEPLYDTVPRRPQALPKPETLERTIEETLNTSIEDIHFDDVSDSLSAESLSDSNSQDSNESSNRKKRTSDVKEKETCTIADGSETSDLGSSGGEDVPSFEEWPSTPSPNLDDQNISGDLSRDPLSPPETALEKLEREVLAEAEKEKNEKRISIKTLASLERATKKEFAIQAVNPSIVSVKSKNEIAEATIIDEEDTSSSVEDLTAPPAIRHSVVIELKDSQEEKTKKTKRRSLKRSGSLNVEDSEKVPSSRKVKTGSKKKNRRMSETGLGISVGVKHNHLTNEKEFYEIPKKTNESQVIEISEDGSWGLKSKDKKSESKKDSDAVGKCKEVSLLKLAKMNEVGEHITAPPAEFINLEGPQGVFSASCVSVNSAPNSLSSDSSNNSSIRIYEVNSISSSEENSDSGKKKHPFWAEEPTAEISANGLDPAEKKKNLGHAIMESYERELTKKKESLNLPEVSMFDFGGDAGELELDRKKVINQMIVKTKKKDTWLTGVSTTDLNYNTKKDPATIKRSNSMSSFSKPKAVLGATGNASKNNTNRTSLFLDLKKKSVSANKSSSPDDDDDDFVFPSFMNKEEEETAEDKPVLSPSVPKPDPLPDFTSIELTIKKLGIDKTSSPPPSFVINKHLTAITPFKVPNQTKQLRSFKSPEPPTEASDTTFKSPELEESRRSFKSPELQESRRSFKSPEPPTEASDSTKFASEEVPPSSLKENSFIEEDMTDGVSKVEDIVKEKKGVTEEPEEKVPKKGKQGLMECEGVF